MVLQYVGEQFVRCELIPSTQGNNSTNAPNVVRRFTKPSNTEPTAARSSILSHGPANVSLIDNDTRPFLDPQRLLFSLNFFANF